MQIIILIPRKKADITAQLILFYIIFFAICINPLFSQQDTSDIYNLDFIQLSKLKISSVSKTPTNLSEVPGTVRIISKEDIKEKGCFTLEDVLADLPGFQFRNTQSFNSYSFQRGIPNQNNLILLLIDGIQTNELNSGGYYGGAQLNLSNIERIEVVYGPGSAAYGTNAVTGIINIITKSCMENSISANSSAGSFNTLSADAAYCYSNEKKNFGLRFAAMVKSSEKADLKGKAGDNNWSDLLDNNETDYTLSARIQANDFTMGSNIIQKNSSAATNIRTTGTNYKDYGTSWNVLFINNYLKYSKRLSDNLSFASTLYNRNATVLDNSVQYVLDTAQIGYYRPNHLIGLESISTYLPSKTLSITGGLILEYEELANGFSIAYSNSGSIKPPTPKSPDMEANRLLGIFIEPQLALFNSLYLSGGVRYDHSSVYDNVFTPRAGISWHFNQNILRVAYSEAFRAPKPWDYTDGLGNSSLLPEKMASVEAGLTASITDNLITDITVYKNSLHDAITKKTLIDGYRWINNGEINTDGIEISVNYSAQYFKAYANYTFTQSLNADKDVIPEISKHTGNAGFTYSITDNFKINVRANYIGARKNTKTITATNSDYIDEALIFSIVGSIMDYKGFNFQLNIKNVFDTEYYHTSNRPPDRYRQAGRTILLTVGYSITN